MTLSPATRARLDAVKDGLKAANLVDFALVQNELEVAEPRPKALPCLWKWQDLKPWLGKTYAGMSLAEVHRRTLALANPGFGGRPVATTTLFMSISMYFPGDEAGVHRHTANASRFLLEGSGGFTNVAGEKLVMGRGDLVITPNGQWHDHGNDGATPIVWVNVLDVALVDHLNAVMTEWDYREGPPGARVDRRTQSVLAPADHSAHMFAAGGVVPRFGPETRGHGHHSPMFIYRWAKTRETLNLLRGEAGSPYDGIVVEYTDPLSGQSVVPTMSFRAQLLRPGEETRLHRHPTNTVYCAIEGSGTTEIDGRAFAWDENDLFVVPGWTWHRHLNKSDRRDACLYSVSDLPLHQKLGIYREQERKADGTIFEVVPWPRWREQE